MTLKHKIIIYLNPNNSIWLYEWFGEERVVSVFYFIFVQSPWVTMFCFSSIAQQTWETPYEEMCFYLYEPYDK